MKSKLNKIIKLVMEYKKQIAIIIAFTAIIIAIMLLANATNTLKCTSNYNLIKGFKNEEVVKFKVSGDKIRKIKYKRTITLNDYYDSYGTYYDSLDKILNIGYKYLGKKKYKVIVNKEDKQVIAKFKTKQGIVLNNLTITGNSKQDDTSLRLDILNDIDNDKNAYKVGKKISKKELRKELEKIGYDCK